jgi:uncharacterized protein
VARKKSRCKLIGNRLVIPHDTIPSNVGIYLNGKRTGKWLYYYPNGQIENIEFNKNGLVDGEFISYHDNGKLSAKGRYEKGNRVGIFHVYNDKGELIEKLNF